MLKKGIFGVCHSASIVGGKCQSRNKRKKYPKKVKSHVKSDPTVGEKHTVE